MNGPDLSHLIPPGLVGPGPLQAVPGVALAPSRWSVPVNGHELWLAHNEVRQAAGLATLRPSELIRRAAQDQADWMSRRAMMEHSRPSGSSPWSRATDEGYTYRWLSENIAWNFVTLDSLMAGWMGSPGHRANILSRDATEMGSGVAGLYYAVVFGRPM